MKISILGAGIGGLSTAIALKQEGFDVTIYERHSKPAEIGAGIVCWPNASFVLGQLGILEKVAEVSGSINEMNRFSSDGEPIGSLDINELNRLMGYSSYSILRKDLMNILVQRTIELKISIYYQHEVIDIADKNHNTVVHFSNGKCIESDVIVGSDGRMNSLSRKYVNGSNTPVYQGFINWVGVAEGESLNFSDLSISDYWGIGKRFGIVPVSKNKAYWAAGMTSEGIDKTNPHEYTSELNQLFHCWPDLISRVIDQTPLSRINKIYVHDHDALEVWHRNKVILLGDAAHAPLPTSGQGACQALEDAWHFTLNLKEHTHDILKVFTSFTETRKLKTSGITMGGRQLAASIFNQDEKFCIDRNLASKNTDFQKVVEGMAKGWSSRLPIGT